MNRPAAGADGGAGPGATRPLLQRRRPGGIWLSPLHLVPRPWGPSIRSGLHCVGGGRLYEAVSSKICLAQSRFRVMAATSAPPGAPTAPPRPANTASVAPRCLNVDAAPRSSSGMGGDRRGLPRRPEGPACFRSLETALVTTVPSHDSPARAGIGRSMADPHAPDQPTSLARQAWGWLSQAVSCQIHLAQSGTGKRDRRPPPRPDGPAGGRYPQRALEGGGPSGAVWPKGGPAQARSGERAAMRRESGDAAVGAVLCRGPLGAGNPGTREGWRIRPSRQIYIDQSGSGGKEPAWTPGATESGRDPRCRRSPPWRSRAVRPFLARSILRNHE